MGDYDMCEYIFSHESAMRRLINLLRDSQSYCTDTECFNETPGPQGSDDGLTGGPMMLMVMACIAFAAIMFVLRPQSLRGNSDEKPRNNNNDGNPPPPSAML